MTESHLGYIQRTIEQAHTYFKEKIKTRDILVPSFNDEKTYVIAMSIGNPDIRAKVEFVKTNQLNKTFKQLENKATKYVRKFNIAPEWLKFDFISEIEAIEYAKLQTIIKKTRRNYFRYGISFDENFNTAFLEQEINGNAMIRSINKGPLELNDKNINHYLNYRKSQSFHFISNTYINKQILIFKTDAIFFERDSDETYALYNGALSNGIRKTEDIEAEAKKLIEESTYFLQDQLLEDGKFEYGYFSAFAKKINTYNILRHCSTLYAMGEGYEALRDPELLKTIEHGINYAVETALVYKDDETAFMVDHANQHEIKLGSNATAILAMAKYMEITESEQYIEEAQALARGILSMKTPSGGFMHVLSHPSFEIKELNRVIYYEGEAVFALLRLYALDKGDLWLKESQKSMDYFIENNYWKNHDHWLSYAANEITDYIETDKYFEFGLKNCNDRLDYIYKRDTTYPTFLELMMAAYKLVQKVKQLDKNELLQHIDLKRLNETIDHRAEYQRVGYFYPEVAMYMKHPGLILHGFYIRHHSLRVRIDDVEHYLSGYCQFVRFRVPDLTERRLQLKL